VIHPVKAEVPKSPVSVGFLCTRYDDSTGAAVRNLLDDLVKQTLERYPASRPLFNEVCGKHIRERTHPSTNEILGFLKRFTSELATPAFYFLDTLDEAPTEVQVGLLESLMSLNARLFINCRPLKDLEARLFDAHQLPIIAQDGNLEVHIGKELSCSTEIQAFLSTASPGLGERINFMVKRQCSGM
jgi:hypothetical protein